MAETSNSPTQFNSTHQERLAFWTAVVDQYEQSGLSRRLFCQQQGLSASKLNYWYYQVMRNSPEQSKPRPKVKNATTIKNNAQNTPSQLAQAFIEIKPKEPSDFKQADKSCELKALTKGEPLKLCLSTGLAIGIGENFHEATLLRLIKLLGGE